MSFNAAQFIESYSLGQPYTLAEQADLQAAEDAIAQNFATQPQAPAEDLALAELSWRHRPSLAEALRDRRFLGRFEDVVVAPMADAKDQLLVEDRIGRRPRQAAIQTAVGFIVIARLASRSLGDLGQTKKPVWLIPRSGPTIYDGLWQRIVGAERGDNTFDAAHRSAIKRAPTVNSGTQSKAIRGTIKSPSSDL